MNFPKFAFNNVSRNGRAYMAYLLSSAFMVMIFFAFAVFIYHPEIRQAPMGALTLISMQVAAYVVFIFAIIFVLYSISAFLKSRNKEFGILMILGAQPGQINRLIFLENMIIGTVSIVTGIAGGLLLSKMFLLFSTKVIDINELAFYWPVKAIVLTASCFIALFIVISLFTLLFIRKNRVLELLQGSSRPKQEPKASIWLSLLGAILLAVGFVVLLKDTLSSKTLVVAAFSGIAGTYFFYSQLSVFIIRLLKRNRKSTWRGTNLLWISEISYKLKDNARMLFLVTVVTSIACISAGFVLAVDQDNKQQFMNNKFAFTYDIFQPKHTDVGLATIEQSMKESGIAFERYRIDSILATRPNVVDDPSKSSDVELVRVSQISEIATPLEIPPFRHLSEQTAVAVYADSNRLPRQSLKLEGTDSSITIVQEISIRDMGGVSGAGVMLIVDDAFFAKLSADLQSRPKYLYYVPAWTQPPSRQDEQSNIGIELYAWNQKQIDETWGVPGSLNYANILTVRSEKYLSTKDTTSVFSFIGVFIALIFSISTASFLYFKLHTELSADSRTYHALSKIGLSSREMSAAATKQIAVIFFIPIPVSTVQTFVVLKPVLGHMRVSYVNTATITVALAFLATQTVYFVIARSRYVKALQKMIM
ncbi:MULTISPECIES: ABC transporter permease [unclassified Paenibacillus]|uniref:FtsX-like permease family protein n=1 Tax=unclassified Paenibacillus TaxID=185978 RepID=UPI00240580D9|nr:MULTISPECIES: ABC transporter permease [unclassified Paenibacillus]MDF9840917.1 putative ABC transport system permease protein [Paenibacillus sp. PastF-2]MDF9847501.1 putative ABC transport system permease protein [Paenibacillus sp. PastM-2]MDF9853922.1 putative ABC transport system permease protein [Paenibacillus sp. PastF-1]MDH6479194.1 putative ABC transport system permease protein [Paenibacillus sp. PastH-2]MDH6507070.1 putative ABC transport system permease protein [Paenibacillus sp. P